MSPFPLTALEEYMLCDDRAAFPMTGVVRLRFSGFLNRAAWEAAVDAVVQRHVLLRATVSPAMGRRPHWVDQPEWRPSIVWRPEVNAWGFPSAGYLDLTQEPGTRFWVAERDDGHDAVLQVHHAKADALGLTRVVEDLLLAYAGRMAPNAAPEPLPELNAESFRQRGAPGLTVGRFLRMLHRQAVGLLGVWEFLTRAPAALCGTAAAPDMAAPPPEYPTPYRHDFSPEETQAFLKAAKGLDATANDLLVRDLYLAVSHWRRQQGMGGMHDWLRFSIPMNLRRREDACMPMANSVSSVFLDRRPADCEDADGLLAGIRRQMQRIKRMQLQYIFLLSLGLSRMLPGGLSARMQTDKCQLTSYFSNVGVLLDKTPLPRRGGRIVSGNVCLESVDYVIPLRPWVNASFCLYTYAGRMSVLMHPDLRTLSPAAANSLLRAFVERVRQSASAAT